VHEEDFAGRDVAAASPDRKITAGAITLVRRADLHSSTVMVGFERQTAYPDTARMSFRSGTLFGG